MKKFLLGAVLTMSASVCHAQSKPPQSAPKLTASGRGVVFAAPLARQFSGQCSRRSPTGWWTSVAPSKVEIAKLEAALPAWMKTVAVPRWNKAFAAYYYQYGAVVRGGKRLIYVNALLTSFASDDKNLWQREPAVVCDGGPNYWGVEWDPKSGKFQNAGFNGFP